MIIGECDANVCSSGFGFWGTWSLSCFLWALLAWGNSIWWWVALWHFTMYLLYILVTSIVFHITLSRPSSSRWLTISFPLALFPLLSVLGVGTQWVPRSWQEHGWKIFNRHVDSLPASCTTEEKGCHLYRNNRVQKRSLTWVLSQYGVLSKGNVLTQR